jgi:hypothetical protein
MNLKRIFTWSLALFLVPQVIGFAQGLSMSHWQLYGATIEEAVANARWTRIGAASAALFALYTLFFKRTPSRHLAHAAVLFIAAEALDVALSFAFGARTISELLFWPTVLRHLGICIAALLAVSIYAMGSNYSLKRTAANGSGASSCVS